MKLIENKEKKKLIFFCNSIRIHTRHKYRSILFFISCELTRMINWNQYEKKLLINKFYQMKNKIKSFKSMIGYILDT